MLHILSEKWTQSDVRICQNKWTKISKNNGKGEPDRKSRINLVQNDLVKNIGPSDQDIEFQSKNRM